MAVRIVIDVEMCTVQARTERYPFKNEIIQIGAVRMDEGFQIQDKFSTYVRPRYGRIDRFIDRLTGISERSVKDAPELAEVDTEGRMHDGLDDAYNTALLIAKLETQKKYKTLIEKLRAREAEQRPLTISLGDYMRGLIPASA